MTAPIESYKDLIVWQQAVDLVIATYAETKRWPREELYGLTSQTRRAATSIPANIAEGFARENRGSYQQFLRIAQGSRKELETHLMIARRIGFAGNRSTGELLNQAESRQAPAPSDTQTVWRPVMNLLPYCLTALLPLT